VAKSAEGLNLNSTGPWGKSYHRRFKMNSTKTKDLDKASGKIW